MKKDDVQITVSVKDSGLSLQTTYDSAQTIRALILALTATLEDVRADDASDAEMENLVLKEYRNAVAFIRKNIESSETSVEYEGEDEYTAQK